MDTVTPEVESLAVVKAVEPAVVAVEPEVAPQAPVVVVAPPAVAAHPIELTVSQYLIRLSQRDKRVELINAFHSDEVRAGKIKDTSQNFTARFKAFCDRPVTS